MADKKIRQLGELLAEMTPESLHDEADFGPPVGNEAGSNQMIAKRIAQVLDFASSIYPDASKLVEFMRRRHPMLASLIHDARFRVRSGHLLRLAVLRGRPASLAFVSPHSD